MFIQLSTEQQQLQQLQLQQLQLQQQQPGVSVVKMFLLHRRLGRNKLDRWQLVVVTPTTTKTCFIFTLV